jgi:hypothetical protein
MKPTILCSIVLAALLSACAAKKPHDVPAPASSATPSAESLAASQTPVPPPPAPAFPNQPASEAAPDNSSPPAGEVYAPPVELARGQMTMFVQQFEQMTGRMPKDLNELVRTPGYLPYIYPAPSGKKWVLDTKAKDVKLVDK